MADQVATATPAAAPPPATVATPVPADAAISPRSPPKPSEKQASVVTKKSYDTGGRHDAASRAEGPRTRLGKPIVAPVVAAAVATPAAAVAPVVAETVEEAEVAPGLESGTLPTATDTPAADEPDADEGISKSEGAKRLAKIVRASAKLSDEKVAFATERRQFQEERTRHATDLERVKQMDQAKELARKDLPGFIHRVFGIPPHEVIDQYIRAGQRKPEEVANETESAREKRLADLEAKLDAAAKQNEEQRVKREVQDYVSREVAPIATDKTRFPFLNHKFGATAAAEVYNIMAIRFNKTGKAPPPSEVADFVERELRTEAEQSAKLLGNGAVPSQPATPKKVGTPTASKTVPAQQAPAVATRRPRNVGRPYTSQAR